LTTAYLISIGNDNQFLLVKQKPLRQISFRQPAYYYETQPSG